MRKILLLIISVALSTGVFAQSFRNTTDKGLNLRNEPNTSSSVIASIPPNGKVTVLDTSDSEWYKVKYDGNTGYVSAKYISEDNNNNSSSNNNRTNNSGNNNNNNNSNNNSSARRNNNSGQSASSYKTGIGLRFGKFESGLTVKHFIKSNAAIEGIISTGWLYRGTRITGLYEIHKAISGAPGLSFFYGGGAHIGFYNERYWYGGDCKDGQYYDKGRWYNCDGTRATIGIDVILGLEYHFTEIPFTIGLDIKPSLDLLGWGSRFGDGAFTVRYAF